MVGHGTKFLLAESLNKTKKKLKRKEHLEGGNSMKISSSNIPHNNRISTFDEALKWAKQQKTQQKNTEEKAPEPKDPNLGNKIDLKG